MRAYSVSIWRARDCWRNSVHGQARCYFSSKQLHNKNSEQQIEMLKQQGLNFHDLMDEFKFGTLLKDKYFPYTSDDGKEYVRKHVCLFSLNVKDEAHRHRDELLAKVTQRQTVSVEAAKWRARYEL